MGLRLLTEEENARFDLLETSIKEYKRKINEAEAELKILRVTYEYRELMEKRK